MRSFKQYLLEQWQDVVFRNTDIKWLEKFLKNGYAKSDTFIRMLGEQKKLEHQN